MSATGAGPGESSLPPAVVVTGVLLGALGAAAVLWSSRGTTEAARPRARFALEAEAGPEGDAGAGASAAGRLVPGPLQGRLAWRYATGGRITGGAVFDRDGGVWVASHDGWLHALDRRGRVRFRRDLGAQSPGGPAVHGGRIFVGTTAGTLHCFDLGGASCGTRNLPAPIVTRPAAGPGGLLLVAAGASVHAFTPAGELVWQRAAYRKVLGGPASDGRRVVFGAQDQRLYLLNGDGSDRAVLEVGADVDAMPVLAADGTTYVGADDGELRAVADDGRVRWRLALGGRLRAPVAMIDAGRLAVVSHGLRPALHVLGAADGRVLARLELAHADSQEYFLRAGPAVGAGPVVYLAAPDQRVIAVGRDGRILWSYAAAGRVHATPVLAPDGTLYVGSDDGTLYAFRDSRGPRAGLK